MIIGSFFASDVVEPLPNRKRTKGKARSHPTAPDIEGSTAPLRFAPIRGQKALKFTESPGELEVLGYYYLNV
jgi:hypothetical protein